MEADGDLHVGRAALAHENEIDQLVRRVAAVRSDVDGRIDGGVVDVRVAALVGMIITGLVVGGTSRDLGLARNAILAGTPIVWLALLFATEQDVALSTSYLWSAWALSGSGSSWVAGVVRPWGAGGGVGSGDHPGATDPG